MERRETQQAHLSVGLLLVLLLLLGTWEETQAWPASLQYDLIVVSQPEPREPLYMALGYINDQLFLHYDGESRRAELQKPWNDTEEGRKVWDMVTQDLEEMGKELRVTLQDILRQNYQSDSSDELPTEVPPGPNLLSHEPLQVELLIMSIGLIFAILVVVGAQLWRQMRAKPEIRPTRRSEQKSAHPLFPGFGNIRETQSMV
ncbi:H-2 class I histocompatibility antigen, D-37 alpha chain-like isoform X4 [Vombatus ursinus]|uniref:H-2 class I histocompatibility antigen, D-37 alpha chain-like isoform X4 n=1 Tax=Vombatus ursinus TaxID=29139 RepID=UPI000FFCEB0C|nr:H-2 class I histocompatibility antigen, D-37 alpha chain-like isoform X4 [Vombatus ursinus]